MIIILFFEGGHLLNKGLVWRGVGTFWSLGGHPPLLMCCKKPRLIHKNHYDVTSVSSVGLDKHSCVNYVRKEPSRRD